MKKEIEQWIDNFVSVHNEEYGQIPCPYARAAKVKYIETDDLGKSLADTKCAFSSRLKWPVAVKGWVTHWNNNSF